MDFEEVQSLFKSGSEVYVIARRDIEFKCEHRKSRFSTGTVGRVTAVSKGNETLGFSPRLEVMMGDEMMFVDGSVCQSECLDFKSELDQSVRKPAYAPPRRSAYPDGYSPEKFEKLAIGRVYKVREW